MSTLDRIVERWEKRAETAAELHRHYRGAGIAFSVSLSSLCGALIFWTENLIQKAPPPLSSFSNLSLFIQFVFLSLTIFLCLSIQFCNYQGYRLEALQMFSRDEKEPPANHWFHREDMAVYGAVGTFIVGLASCIATFVRTI